MKIKAEQKIILGVIILSLINLASAGVYISYPVPAVISINPQNINQVVEFTNNNLSETPIVSLSFSSSVSSYLDLSASSVQVPSHNSVTISAKTNISNISVSGLLNYNSESIPISVYFPAQYQPQDYSQIIVFPTSKIITLQQGTQKTQNIMLTVPNNYPRSITIQSLDFSPGAETIQFGDLNLGQLNPGQSLQIPIIFDATKAQTGNYQTGLNIFALDPVEGMLSLPVISLVMQVTTGITPVTNETFSSPPSCSLSATTLNINTTYSFTCSNPNSNIQIEPAINEYFEGKSVDISSGVYKYNFIATKYGITKFIANFRYKGSPIFKPYEQEVRISSSGSVIPGTTLKFLFTPGLEYADGIRPIIIQIVDNKSGSLVLNPRLWIDAKEINDTSDIFEYILIPNRLYELRAKADGYDDLVSQIIAIPNKITITISPTSGDTSTIFNITTSIENATLKINNISVSNHYYNTLSPGLNIISAEKEGYIISYVNMTIEDYFRVLTPAGVEIKKGEEYNVLLNRNASSISIYYRKDLNSLERELIATGSGINLTFKASKSGIYEIDADGKRAGSLETKSFWSNELLGISYFWLALIVSAIIVLTIAILLLSSKKPTEQGGLTYQVGSGAD